MSGLQTFIVLGNQDSLSEPPLLVWASQVVLVVKNPPADAGDARDVHSIPGSGKSPGGRQGNPLQYSCLENPMDRGAWRATVPRVTKSQTLRKRLSMQHAQFRVKHFPLAVETRDKNTRKNFWLFWWGSCKGMTHNCWWPCLPFTRMGWKIQTDTERSYNQQLFIKHLLCVKTESGVKDT